MGQNKTCDLQWSQVLTPGVPWQHRGHRLCVGKITCDQPRGWNCLCRKLWLPWSQVFLCKKNLWPEVVPWQRSFVCAKRTCDLARAQVLSISHRTASITTEVHHRDLLLDHGQNLRTKMMMCIHRYEDKKKLNYTHIRCRHTKGIYKERTYTCIYEKHQINGSDKFMIYTYAWDKTTLFFLRSKFLNRWFCCYKWLENSKHAPVVLIHAIYIWSEKNPPGMTNLLNQCNRETCDIWPSVQWFDDIVTKRTPASSKASCEHFKRYVHLSEPPLMCYAVAKWRRSLKTWVKQKQAKLTCLESQYGKCCPPPRDTMQQSEENCWVWKPRALPFGSLRWNELWTAATSWSNKMIKSNQSLEQSLINCIIVGTRFSQHRRKENKIQNDARTAAR